MFNRGFKSLRLPLLLGSLALLHLFLQHILAFLCPTIESAALLCSLGLLLALSVIHRRVVVPGPGVLFMWGSLFLQAATTAILAMVDAADFSLFGHGFDGETGLLLGVTLSVGLLLAWLHQLCERAPETTAALALLIPPWTVMTLFPVTDDFHFDWPWPTPCLHLLAFLGSLLVLRRLDTGKAPWARLLATLACAAWFAGLLALNDLQLPADWLNAISGLVAILLLLRLVTTVGDSGPLALHLCRMTAAKARPRNGDRPLAYRFRRWMGRLLVGNFACAILLLSLPCFTLIPTMVYNITLTDQLDYFPLSLLESLPLAKKAALALHDVHYFREQLPWTLPESEDPQEAINALVQGTPDYFSYFSSHEELVNRGEINGELPSIGRFGLSYGDYGGSWRIFRVQTDSPAEKAGVSRGDELVAVNGLTAQTGQHPFAYEPRPGETMRLTLKGRDGHQRTVSLEATAEVQDGSFHRLLETPAGPVGYLFVPEFRLRGFKGIDTALKAFEKAGVQSLVLDLRDNGGGLVSLQVSLASSIIGPGFAGKELQRYRHSRRYRDQDYISRFSGGAGRLAITKLVVLTSGETCSASEALINSLSPYIPVATVGETTCGKPLAMNVIDVETPLGTAEMALVTSEVRNSRDEGGYYDGIAPTCPVPDIDLEHDLGDAQEALLRTGLDWLATGRCGKPEGVYMLASSGKDVTIP